MKKITLLFGLIVGAATMQAQNGLEGIIVEKYYVSNADDAAGSIGTLPVGSVTYRVYADMLPGYKFQGIFSTVTQDFKITTTTTFFNNEDRGATTPNGIASAQLKNNSVALDSWLSISGAATGQVGVLKTEDDNVANLLPISSNTMLKNNNPYAGIPLSISDGIIAGTPYTVGMTPGLDLSIFDATSQQGGTFSINDNGGIYIAGGASGPTASNIVLIGQFTTDGDFGFELNIQIGTPTAGVERYVAKNPNLGEIVLPSLILVPNVAPTCSITAPATSTSVTTGDVVTITADALDSDGTIDSVQFFDGSTLIGVMAGSPYTITWTSTTGSHNITAKAFDNDGAVTISSVVVVNANPASNQLPTISASAPSSANAADVVTITATAADPDGTVSQVEFFVDGVSIGVDNSSPFTFDWTAVAGNHTFYGIVTDNSGGTTTSTSGSINVTSIGINNLEADNFVLAIYPNPTKDILTIDILNSKSINNICSIYDITGSLIYKSELGDVSVKYTEKVNLSTFPKGLYFVVLSLDGTVKTQKIIKN